MVVVQDLMYSCRVLQEQEVVMLSERGSVADVEQNCPMLVHYVVLDFGDTL